jgi:hypothetical protein
MLNANSINLSVYCLPHLSKVSSQLLDKLARLSPARIKISSILLPHDEDLTEKLKGLSADLNVTQVQASILQTADTAESKVRQM